MKRIIFSIVLLILTASLMLSSYITGDVNERRHPGINFIEKHSAHFDTSAINYIKLPNGGVFSFKAATDRKDTFLTIITKSGGISKTEHIYSKDDSRVSLIYNKYGKE